MKITMKYYWIALIIIFIISAPATAQIKGSTETNKQAKLEIRAEQKREKKRINEERMAKAKVEKTNKDFQDKKTSNKRKSKTKKTENEPKKKEFE